MQRMQAETTTLLMFYSFEDELWVTYHSSQHSSADAHVAQ